MSNSRSSDFFKRAVALGLAGLVLLPPVAYAGPASRSQFTVGKVQARPRFTTLQKVMAASAVTGGVLAGGLAYHMESARETHIPLAFSEISQIERDAAAKDETLSPATRYLATTNETAMKVFEAWNLSHEHLRLGSEASKFAKELELKLNHDPHSHTLPSLFEELPTNIQTLRASLRPLQLVHEGLRPVNAAMRAAWDDSHHDNYHTEWRTRTVSSTDSKGKTTYSTETYSEQVYDDTTHTYTYNKGQGEAGSAKLDALRALQPSLTGLPQLRTASATHAEGDYAQDKSRGLKGTKVLTAAQHQEIANLWASGSTYTQNINTLINGWNKVLLQDGNAWRTSKATAHDARYKTTSHSDSGPQEFQVGRRTQGDGEAFVQRADEIMKGISYTQDKAAVLQAKIRELVKRELDNQGTANSAKLTDEIMSTTREMYTSNFKRGVDVKAFRAWVVLLWVLAGVGIAGAVPAGARAARARLAR